MKNKNNLYKGQNRIKQIIGGRDHLCHDQQIGKERAFEKYSIFDEDETRLIIFEINLINGEVQIFEYKSYI